MDMMDVREATKDELIKFYIKSSENEIEKLEEEKKKLIRQRDIKIGMIMKEIKRLQDILERDESK